MLQIHSKYVDDDAFVCDGDDDFGRDNGDDGDDDKDDNDAYDGVDDDDVDVDGHNFSPAEPEREGGHLHNRPSSLFHLDSD